MTVGAVIAAESAKATDTPREIAATVTVVILYWLAHSYAVLLGQRLDTGRHISWSVVWHALVKEWAIVRGASVPVLAMLTTWALGYSINAVEWAGLITVTVLLVLFEIAAGLRSKLSTLGVFVQSLVGVGLGVGIMLVRALLS